LRVEAFLEKAFVSRSEIRRELPKRYVQFGRQGKRRVHATPVMIGKKPDRASAKSHLDSARPMSKLKLHTKYFTHNFASLRIASMTRKALQSGRAI
jgi:hypothetical protein